MTDERLESRAGAFRESPKTIEERTQSFIKDAISRGEYKPGEQLCQGELATLLGVSRITVRASLRKLEAAGLVEIRPNVGAVVQALRPEQVVEIYELRILLETYLLRHAAARLTPERLGKIGGELGGAHATSDTADSWGRRHSFYHSLYEFADRPRALEMADRLRLAVGRYLLQQRIDEYSDAHLQLLDRAKGRRRRERRRDARGAPRQGQRSAPTAVALRRGATPDELTSARLRRPAVCAM